MVNSNEDRAILFTLERYWYHLNPNNVGVFPITPQEAFVSICEAYGFKQSLSFNFGVMQQVNKHIKADTLEID